MKKYQVEVFSVYRETLEVEADSPTAAAVRLLADRGVGRYIDGEYAGLLPEAGVEGVASVRAEGDGDTAEFLDQVAMEIRQAVQRSFVTRYRLEDAGVPDAPAGVAQEALDELEDELNSRYGR